MFDRFRLPPRLVDWSIAAALTVALATGLVSLVAGRPAERLVFVLHGIGGLCLCVLVYWKLTRVEPRITNPAAWDRATPVSVLLAAATIGALGSGIAWVHGASLEFGPWGLLNLHVGLGLVVVPVVLGHLYHRWRPPAKADLEGRRTALSYLVLVGAGALTWRLQGLTNRALKTAGAERRFTGSREEGTDAGNAFPVTSWVADDPDPIDVEGWTLRVGGAVERELALEYEQVDPDGERTVFATDSDGDHEGADRPEEADTLRAALDCTSGWYSIHDWRGVRVGDLLEAVDPAAEARWVCFRSVTGYRWSLPIEEARDALLATHVGEERLSHGHGFPLRLVAPGRRGFQWVKWVTAVELRERKDLGQWLAIFVSGFDEE